MFLTGIFNGIATFGSTTLVSGGLADIFVAKLDGNGSWLWVKKAGAGGPDNGYGISVDPDGNSYITGDFEGIAHFGSITIQCTGPKFDMFVAKLLPTGSNIPPAANFSWDPLYPTPNQVITFDGSGSYDLDGTVDLYEWDWDNDGVFDEISTSPTISYMWNNSGFYPVTLRVTD